MINAVLFDKDGTLIDFNGTWGVWAKSFIRELSDGNDDLAYDMARAIAFDLDAAKFHPESPVIAGTPDEGVRLLHPFLPNWDYDDLLSRSNQRAKEAPLAPVVDTPSFLSQLRQRGFKLGVATNDAESTAHDHMSALGVADSFDVIIGSDSGFGGKPAPGMCLAFAEQVDVAPEQIAMVGDSTHDLIAGRAAGMTCVGVLTGVADAAALTPDADIVFPDISHLPDWLLAS
ncbi:MAG: HAD family hydrolase [Pseudomonadota bacterium]